MPTPEPRPRKKGRRSISDVRDASRARPVTPSGPEGKLYAPESLTEAPTRVRSVSDAPSFTNTGSTPPQADYLRRIWDPSNRTGVNLPTPYRYTHASNAGYMVPTYAPPQYSQAPNLGDDWQGDSNSKPPAYYVASGAHSPHPGYPGYPQHCAYPPYPHLVSVGGPPPVYAPPQQTIHASTAASASPAAGAWLYIPSVAAQPPWSSAPSSHAVPAPHAPPQPAAPPPDAAVSAALSPPAAPTTLENAEKLGQVSSVPPPVSAQEKQRESILLPKPLHLQHQQHQHQHLQPNNLALSAVPGARRGQQRDPLLERFFSCLRREYPKLTDDLLSLTAPILIMRDSNPPHRPRGETRFISCNWLRQTCAALEESQPWIHEVFTTVLSDLKKAFLGGKRLEAFGGNLVESSTGPRQVQLQLPGVSSEDAEGAIRMLLAHPEVARAASKSSQAPPPARRVLKLGKRVAMPQELNDFLENDGLLKLHKTALQNLPELLKESKDLIISEDIDFGAVRMTGSCATAVPGFGNHTSLQELVETMTAREEAWALNPAAKKGGDEAVSRIRVRDIHVTASSRPATLVDVRAFPDHPSTFAMVDDWGICRASKVQPSLGDAAVRLLPGDTYSVVLLLDTADGYHRAAESGLLHQMVLFTLVLEGADSTLPSTSCSRLLKDKKMVMVLGCRVSVALNRRVEDLQSLLSHEAKPFITERLRVLFDQAPSRFHADPPPLDAMFKAREMVNDICAWQGAETQLKPPPPACYNLGACHRIRTIPDFSIQRQADAGPRRDKSMYWESQFRKYARLLLLEEFAMEDQIRRHDLFNVRHQFAVFEPGERPQYRLHDKFPAYNVNYEAPPLSALPRKTFRGPQLNQILRTNNLAGICSRRVLLVLEVPGLPEERPSLVFGDTVYIRFACADHIEFAGFVIATETTRCMVLMPRQFYLCCILKVGPGKDNAQEVLGPPVNVLKKKDFSLVHARFGFDRTRMHRMHNALLAGAQNTTFNVLPPEPLDKYGESSVEAGLPSTEDFLEAAMGKGRKEVRPVQGRGDPPEPLGATVCKTAAAIEEVGQRRLNTEQRWAVASVLEGAGGDCPYTLFGPPGTGKTVTLVECALQVLKRDKDARLLLCAPQGYSADLLASALGQAGVTKKDMLRIADPRHPPVQMKEDVLNNFSTYDDQLRAFSLPDPVVVASKRVIVMTCGAAGILRSGVYRSFHDTCRAADRTWIEAKHPCGLEFSHIFIDEAGQAMLPEAIVPLSLLQPTHGKAMLCGDPKQLGPVVRSLPAASGADGKGLAVSLLERFIEHNSAGTAGRICAGLAPATGTLVQNYRSHSSLLTIPNALFYNDTLVAAADQSELLPPTWSELQAPKAGPAAEETSQNGRPTDGEDTLHKAQDDSAVDRLPMANGAGVNGRRDREEHPEAMELPSTLFFGVRGEQMREGEAPSYFNPIEATTLVDLLEGLLKQHETKVGRPAVTQDDIGVIATYRKQVQKIRLLLRKRGLGGIRVGTVDDLQGQEERIIFISTVLSKPETMPATGGKDQDLNLGFWRNPKRFNVAITRAKALLVVLGHPMVLIEDNSWRELLRHCAARGAYRGAGSQVITHLVRSDGLTSAHFPGLTDALAAEQTGEEHDEDLAAAVGQIAEMALLGVGHAAQMYPETLDESYAAYGEEVQWRVVL